ncbi:MAG: GDP-mannose 4,6-dehydratase, partial [Candidatus Babeliales bacterium]
LEALRMLRLENHIRMYQASTSELFGNACEVPQTEETPFRPCSPYAAAKVYAYWITKTYREAYNMFCCNGILFNHESPLRGELFVTKKITKAVAAINAGQQKELYLGNLNACRDWGYAGDYVEAMWRMLQHDYPDDYIVATGQIYSVRQFVEKAFSYIGVKILWEGEGMNEVGYDKQTGREYVFVSEQHFRPYDIQALMGDARKAKKVLGWQPTMSFDELVYHMVEGDIRSKAMTQSCDVYSTSYFLKKWKEL